jgi:carbamoyltransferase
MNILGINAYHGDSSAALVVDGQLVAAVEEERFNRIKHWAGFPAESIRYVLQAGGVSIDQVQHIAISFNPKANLGRKALFTLINRPSLRSVLDRLSRQGKTLSIHSRLAEVCGVAPSRISAQIHNVEHHDAHLACGFDLSPYDSAAILSIDGMGDFVSTVTARGDQLKISKFHEVFYPHSLGFLYNALSIYLGFPNYGDEYKVMGLAPYGQPEYLDEFRKIIFPRGKTFELNLDYFTHPQRGISMSWDEGNPRVEAFHSPLLEQRLGPPRQPKDELTKKHENLAASLQRVTEEIIFHLLNHLHEDYPTDNVVLVGGCAMNSVANGKVTLHTPFKNVYIPAGAADNGTSFGAAFHVWHQTLGRPRTFQLAHALWGNSWSDEEVAEAIEAAGLPAEHFQPRLLLDRVVDELCAGKIVGWFQGRMEFGARALGNRSLLADPRRADMRDIINLKIKFRERFRPFAPSILQEHVGEYFEIDAPSPFMEKVFQIRPDKRAEIPAVTHVDGSGRLQSVSRDTNPMYWELIERFRQRTGVPIVLNTSLNENEPIVRTPAEAISCFLRTSMDLLVLGGYVINRTHPEFPHQMAATVKSGSGD